jgi:hypothetical protein
MGAFNQTFSDRIGLRIQAKPGKLRSQTPRWAGDQMNLCI